MYRKSWRYYRDSALVWSLIILMLATAAYALRHPAYWIVVLVLWAVRNPVRKAFVFAHPFRWLGWLPETSLNFQEVTFKSQDGLTLFGRFVRSKNHATILLLHPLHSAGNRMLLYAESLVKVGYGVFMVDLRAHGSSDGDTSTYGLREAEDVVGAVEYLLHRLDVNGQKIGVLGISLGAQAALRGALKTDCIRALALEGLGPASLNDHGWESASLPRRLSYPFHWMYYHVYEFMIADKNTSVTEIIGKVAPRPLLLIAGGVEGVYFNRNFFRAAKEPKELWELPEAEHGSAILLDAQAYTQRVVGFFDKVLL
ncbi:MAG TPA: alpha/beta fold hydrolase [Anaerolineales bacterium]|nr:alpha/beta fold hydrolase [Anaerolineales bacterium]